MPTSAAADMPSPDQTRAVTIAELARFARGADEVTLLNFSTVLATVAGQQIQRRIGHSGCASCSCKTRTVVDCRWCGHQVAKVVKRAGEYCSRNCEEQALTHDRRQREAAACAAYGTSEPATRRPQAQSASDPGVRSGVQLAMASGSPQHIDPPSRMLDWPNVEPDQATERAHRQHDDAVRNARTLYGTSAGVGYDPDTPAGHARR